MVSFFLDLMSFFLEKCRAFFTSRVENIDKRKYSCLSMVIYSEFLRYFTFYFKKYVCKNWII